MDASGLKRDLDAFADRYISSNRLPCVACAVSVDREFVYKAFHGYQNKTEGTQLNPDGVYWIASCTKAVTGVAALQLYERGMWRLEDEVSKFIPAFKNVPGVAVANDKIEPLERPILMRDLVTHTAGLVPLSMVQTLRDGRPNTVAKQFDKKMFKAYSKGKLSNLSDFVQVLATVPLVAQPGVSWEYGWSMDVLGRVIEVLSDMQLDAYFDKYIFNVLGMTSTCFVQNMTSSMGDRRVHPMNINLKALMKNGKKFFSESFDGDPMVELTQMEKLGFPPQTSFLMGGGGLMTTLGDFMKFAQCLCSGGVGGPNGQRILREETVALLGQDLLTGDCIYRPMTSLINSRPKEDAAAGMSVGVTCVARPEHSLMAAGAFEWGGIPSTIFWVDPVNKLAVVCFTQLGPFPVYHLRSELKDVIYKYVGVHSSKNLRSRL